DRRGVVARTRAVRAPDRERAVLRLARQAVLEDDHRAHLVRALRRRDVVALDAQRRRVEAERLLDLLEGLAARREVARAPSAVQRERLLGVAVHRLREGALVAALRHTDPHLRPAQPREPGADLLDVRREDRDEDLARDGVGHGVLLLGTCRTPPVTYGRGLLDAVHLLQQVLDELGVGDVLDLLHDPAALAPDASVADVEDLDRGLELVAG